MLNENKYEYKTECCAVMCDTYKKLAQFKHPLSRRKRHCFPPVKLRNTYASLTLRVNSPKLLHEQ